MSQQLQIATETLDAILHLQFCVAWAGEALADPPRLKWWRTDLIDENSGGDFMQRLLPRTHKWASLEAVREAARLVDQKNRKLLADPDTVRTLFFWGFELDELLNDRIREQKSALASAPELGKFQREALEKEWKALAPEASFNVQSTGRQIRGAMPDNKAHAARILVAALVPLAEPYPTPFFRVQGS